MFPPGHPDYVPLPPGEAALIAGRQHIHAQERLAPHWSNVVFKSPTGAEIRAQVEPHSALKGPSQRLNRALVTGICRKWLVAQAPGAQARHAF